MMAGLNFYFLQQRCRIGQAQQWPRLLLAVGGQFTVAEVNAIADSRQQIGHLSLKPLLVGLQTVCCR